MKYLYEMQESLAFSKTQINEFRIVLISTNGLHIKHRFLCLHITLNNIDHILFLPKQNHAYLCHVSCHLCLGKE
jgi:hypothetical protein